MICRTEKSKDKIGKVLFIDAKNEITRKDTFSFLETKHISKILDAYHNYKDIDNFAAVKTNDVLLKNDSSLSVHYYVNHVTDENNEDGISIHDACNAWAESASLISKSSKEVMLFVRGGKKYE